MEIGVPTLLTIIFVILQLTGAISWSWWWVLSPLWICAGIYVVLGVFLVVAYLVTGKQVVRALTKRYRR